MYAVSIGAGPPQSGKMLPWFWGLVGVPVFADSEIGDCSVDFNKNIAESWVLLRKEAVPSFY